MNILRVALWDMRRIGRDWRAALWMLVLPLVFAFVFGSAFRGGGQQGTWIPVIDLDQTEISAAFMDQLHEEGYYIDRKNSKDIGLLKTNWPYGVVVPAGFQQQILKGERVKVAVVKGTGGADRVLEVQACVIRAIMRMTTGLAEANVCSRPWDDTNRDALKRALSKPQLLAVTRVSDRGLRPAPNGFYMSLPGMLAMFVLQMILIYGGVSLLEDRINGQFARLTMSPMHLREIYTGKVLARIVLGMLQAAVLLGAGALLFKMYLGDHALFLIPVIGAYGIFAGSLSILAGVLCRTEKQIIQLGIFLAMFLSALGGCWWPVEIVPEVFKKIAMFTPTFWGMHGVQRVMYFNKSFEVLTTECVILLVFAAACLIPAALIVKRMTLRKSS